MGQGKYCKSPEKKHWKYEASTAAHNTAKPDIEKKRRQAEITGCALLQAQLVQPREASAFPAGGQEVAHGAAVKAAQPPDPGQREQLGHEHAWPRLRALLHTHRRGQGRTPLPGPTAATPGCSMAPAGPRPGPVPVPPATGLPAAPSRNPPSSPSPAAGFWPCRTGHLAHSGRETRHKGPGRGVGQEETLPAASSCLG